MGGIGGDVSYYLPKLQEFSAINVAMTRVRLICTNLSAPGL